LGKRYSRRKVRVAESGLYIQIPRSIGEEVILVVVKVSAAVVGI
jgi:hypothetical protein